MRWRGRQHEYEPATSSLRSSGATRKAVRRYLDLTSVRQLESALNHYQGALIVCSHDWVFLRTIGADRWLTLADGTLRDVDGPPDV